MTLLRREVPVGVVYTGYNVILRKWSHNGFEQRVDGVITRSNFDDDGARPVPYLQLVSPVQSND